MSIIKTHKVRLVTNNAEATLLARHQGYARFAFNHALADFREGLDAGEWRGDKTLRPRFNAVKRTLAPWSASLSQNASKYAIVELGQAIEAFGTYRKAVRAGKKANTVGFPRFRKRTSASGFRADNGPGTVRLEGKSIRLPKIGTLRTRESLRFDGDVVEVTVKREAGRWFACVAVRMTETPPFPCPDEVPDEAIGVDVGIKTLAVCSDGTVYENPRALRKVAVTIAPFGQVHCPVQKRPRQESAQQPAGAPIPTERDGTRPGTEHQERRPAQGRIRYNGEARRQGGGGDPERIRDDEESSSVPRPGRCFPGRFHRQAGVPVRLAWTRFREG